MFYLWRLSLIYMNRIKKYGLSAGTARTLANLCVMEDTQYTIIVNENWYDTHSNGMKTVSIKREWQQQHWTEQKKRRNIFYRKMKKTKQTNRNLLRIYFCAFFCCSKFRLKNKKKTLKNDVNTEKIYLHKNKREWI